MPGYVGKRDTLQSEEPRPITRLEPECSLFQLLEELSSRTQSVLQRLKSLNSWSPPESAETLLMVSEWHLDTQSDVTSLVNPSISTLEKLNRLIEMVRSRDALPARRMARANVFRLQHWILSGLLKSSGGTKVTLAQRDDVDIAVEYQTLQT
ncbi:hypothetical protein SIIN_3972_T [Serendipita indica DSM 11827]|nr:hypothetical protein SIIN_3972_T [Serendipita indica DSM 11827]